MERRLGAVCRAVAVKVAENNLKHKQREQEEKEKAKVETVQLND